jgi:hypothetical protein
LTGELELPQVTFHELEPGAGVAPEPPDPELERLKQRLGKAGEILKQKRARLH